MFTAYRTTLRYGRETDPTDLTIKEYDTLEKALAYIFRYAKGIKFVSAYIEDEQGRYVYEIVDYGAKYFDHRKELGLA